MSCRRTLCLFHSPVAHHLHPARFALFAVVLLVLPCLFRLPVLPCLLRPACPTPPFHQIWHTAGISNNTGAWITPGFQLHLSKVDQVSPKPPAALAGMRFPAALAACRQQVAESQQQQQQGVGQSELDVQADGQQQHPQQTVFDFLPDVADQHELTS